MSFHDRILRTDHVFAAAEIAKEADALIAELYSALRAIQGNYNEKTIARARKAMASYHRQC